MGGVVGSHCAILSRAWCAVGVWGRGRDYLGRTDRSADGGRRHLDVDRVPPTRGGQRPARDGVHPAPCSRVADGHAGDGRRDRRLGDRLGHEPGLQRAHVDGRGSRRSGGRPLRGERVHPRPPARARPGGGQGGPDGQDAGRPVAGAARGVVDALEGERRVAHRRRPGRHRGAAQEAGHRVSDHFVDRNRLWSRLNTALEALPEPPSTPIAVVDLDVFDANADDLVRRAGGKPIRVASKSLRVPALIRRALAHDGFAGVLAYTLAEALWLHETGVSDDIVVAYPTVDAAALRRLTSSPSAAAAITLMVDDPAHLDAVDATRASLAVPIRVALDVDAGLRVGGQHIGPKRSPLFDTADVVALARRVVGRQGFRLVGMMTYEGQVAGVQDDVPDQRTKSLLVRRLKQASMAQLEVRRREISGALAPIVELEFWNGGGSGSVEATAADGAVTEIAAGSGLLVPGIFDHYASFEPRPAAFFGLRVSRKPQPTIATVHGGGLIASGATGADRSPVPWAPPGLHLTGLEGAGEVQTPLTGHPATLLGIGDLVWFRHAKSGELFEHVREVHLVRGDAVVEVVPSYRGSDRVF
ncbi:amino acid deaminase/aldolase [Nocardioides ganghwensis]|uniref:Amino acid deaminase/aldolase n=1 Tax=Nocardioides ganghwensis TaxID=252230 RepID=A0A4Q2SCB8_9ACTN|nr:amino acid deaminase/aldolase [Nocardioides ganghwensis]